MYSQLLQEKLNADDMKINQLTSLTKKGFYLRHCDAKRCDIIRVFCPAVNSKYHCSSKPNRYHVLVTNSQKKMLFLLLGIEEGRGQRKC